MTARPRRLATPTRNLMSLTTTRPPARTHDAPDLRQCATLLRIGEVVKAMVAEIDIDRSVGEWEIRPSLDKDLNICDPEPLELAREVATPPRQGIERPDVGDMRCRCERQQPGARVDVEHTSEPITR
jgi:hypothetical protein